MKVQSGVSYSRVLKARLRQSLLDTYTSRKRTARNVLLQLLRYERLVSRFSVSTDVELTEKVGIRASKKGTADKLESSEKKWNVMLKDMCSCITFTA